MNSEALCNDWQANLDFPDDILYLALDSSENCRKSEPSPTLKLLEAPNDDSNKKHIRSVSSTQTKERRKVQLMEQPGRNTNGRSPQVIRAMNSNQGRPMSADDIQKAKLRAAFMQSKYGKTGTASNESRQQKAEDQKKSSTQNSQVPSPSKAPVEQVTKESERPVVLPSVTSPKLPEPSGDSLPEPSVDSLPEPSVESLPEPSMDSKLSINSPPELSMISMPSLTAEESPWEKLKRNQIPWQLPTEIMNSEWKVRVGDNSKEVEIQTRRIKREKETIYQRNQDIPSNPKEPWDLEMDYDDTLTPQIPTEQAPEEFSLEQAPEAELLQAPLPQANVETTSLTRATPATSISVSDNAAEPDLELLAVLLKNPELVFALTSGQGGNISSADTVKLLDLIKNTGGGLTGVLNGLKGPSEEEPVSFPSPTPYSLPSPTPTSLPSPTPSEHVMNGWRSEVRNNSFQQPVSVPNREAYVQSQTAPSVPSPIKISATGLVQHQSQTTNFTPGFAQVQSQTTQAYQGFPVNNQENIPWGLNWHSIPVTSHQERQFPQMNQNSNPTPSAYNPPQQNTLAAAYSRLQPESTSFGQISLQPETVHYGQMQSVQPAPVSVVLNLPDGTPITLPPLIPTQQPQQSSLLPEQSFLQPMHPSMQWNGTTSSRQSQVGNTKGGRQMSYDASGSNPWSQSNQNNYDSYPGEPPMRLPMPDNSTWERNEYQDEPHFETYNPDRLERSRSPEYRSGRDYSEPRRDRGRNPRPDWSRRRDSGRRDNKQGNSRWRDRRF
ncbi:Homeobox protein luminidependens [Thalictrum thalictroides]|uniref:Homeobox protein luminidependens n=1 Tax=Thalictrum thalictroides TaxID=46969 RepID=A0A7J6X0K2_THATH|nr:Homeobox protein luminidependens [Thalictrum thalictroides]